MSGPHERCAGEVDQNLHLNETSNNILYDRTSYSLTLKMHFLVGKMLHDAFVLIILLINILIVESGNMENLQDIPSVFPSRLISPGLKAPKKAWWAKEITPDFHVSGRLSERQMKYAAEAGFKSILSLFTYPSEDPAGSFGGDYLPVTDVQRDMVEKNIGLQFIALLEPMDEWAHIEAVEKFTAIIPKLKKPSLLHCDRGYTIAFVALLYMANQTRYDPEFQPKIYSKEFYEITASMGLDFLSRIPMEVVSQVTGEPIPEITALQKPELEPPEWLDYWFAHPVYKNWFVAGQISKSHLGPLKEFGYRSVINLRLGLTHEGKPSQEEVNLLNIRSGTGTYGQASTNIAPRQSEERLNATRIDPNQPNSFICDTCTVNYEQINEEEFGDAIGYNEQLQMQTFEKSGLDYYHMPFKSVEDNSKDFEAFFSKYKDDLMEIGTKGPVLVHCARGYRAAVVAVLAAAVQYDLSLEWALQRMKEMGFGMSVATHPDILKVYKHWLRSTQRNASSTNGPFYQVVVKEEAPFVMTKTDSNGKTTFSGLAVDLLQRVSEKAGFDYDIKLTKHVSYAYKDYHGKWNGLISELEGNSIQNADLAVGPITIPTTRNTGYPDFAEFTKPFLATGVNLLIKYPPETKRGITLSLEPFATEVWLMICLAFIVVSLALFLIGRFSPFEWARVAKEKDYRHARTSFGFKNSFLFTANTMSLQGYREAPRSIAGRILICMWFMFSVFILLAYVASLSSILSARRDSMPQQVPFTTYEDMVESKQVTLGAIKYSNVYSILTDAKKSHNVLESKIFDYIDSSQEWFQDKKEGIQRVKDSGGQYAILMETLKADYITATNCDLITYGEKLIQSGYAFATKKLSPLTERINMAILELIENGELHRLHTKYFISQCPDYDKSKLVRVKSEVLHRSMAVGLDMKDLAIPFLFLFLGLLGAALALGAEIYYKKKFIRKGNADEKVREPLNTESAVSKAPKVSPPPPPIYKVNNKLQEAEREKKREAEKLDAVKMQDVDNGIGIELAIVDEHGKEETREEIKLDDGIDKIKNLEPSDDKLEEIKETV